MGDVRKIILHKGPEEGLGMSITVWYYPAAMVGLVGGERRNKTYKGL